MKTGFDNEKYLKMQSEHIRERISKFGDKLYLEFGGKLFDDYHASRVLPGFEPDSKLRMLMKLSDRVEIILVINSNDIEKNKIRGDLGITYDEDVIRLIREFESRGLYVGSVVLTQFKGQGAAEAFEARMEKRGYKVYHHYRIEGYPSNVALIASDDGFGKNDYIETSRPLVVVTAPGPGSGKMATCLSQLYHENKRGIKAGYAKFETFPIWNIPLKHPVNLAYEAATADLNDVNMIDPFHLEAYGQTTVNYNRDIEIFPVLNSIFEGIYGYNPYKSPTDMGVNMAGNCIIDDDVCCEASRMEIIRRYYTTLNGVVNEKASENEVLKIELIMKQAGINTDDRKVTVAANKRAEDLGVPCAAIELQDGRIITSKTTDLLGASAALLLNALKELAGIDHKLHVISREAIEPIQTLKTEYLGGRNPRLHTDEILIALAMSAVNDKNARAAMEQLHALKGCQVHTSVMLAEVDIKTFKKLGVDLTSEPRRKPVAGTMGTVLLSSHDIKPGTEQDVRTKEPSPCPTLVIMAAGMGSRYGGLKQIDPVDEQGNKIIDFSIYDAIRAGFSKVVFVIKKENEQDFRTCIGDVVKDHIEVEYAFQELSDIPAGCEIPEGRVKPWGTAHAVLSARKLINGPFAVINADDFYGREAFKIIYDFLSGSSDDEKYRYAMVGYELKNTLTENGYVSRGLCTTDKDGYLTDIVERTHIEKTAAGAAFTEDNGATYTDIDENSIVSMNMWGFSKSFIDEAGKSFERFFKEVVPGNPQKAECYLPGVVDELLTADKATVRVLKSKDRWFGVTYKEDKPFVMGSIKALKDKGEYPEKLW